MVFIGLDGKSSIRKKWSDWCVSLSNHTQYNIHSTYTHNTYTHNTPSSPLLALTHVSLSGNKAITACFGLYGVCVCVMCLFVMYDKKQQK